MNPEQERVVELYKKLHSNETEIKSLRSQLSQAKFDLGCAMSDILRMRRMVEAVELEKQDLEKTINTLEKTVMGYKRWLKAYDRALREEEK